ncbi:hypothetical protein A5681_09845 [Mycobacterium scrofulaceum]|uniref:hypothetical protein n=1 Tax=Mycobacterium scrofulaceum TaxID=1783 RepID=UPI0007FEA3D6|nr:hypothetical protein [Mycobacterium scrofulaceum]OBH75931.1 hypothetical protein A5681_09845 [Mycobacterium scrofulaceum]
MTDDYLRRWVETRIAACPWSADEPVTCAQLRALAREADQHPRGSEERAELREAVEDLVDVRLRDGHDNPLINKERGLWDRASFEMSDRELSFATWHSIKEHSPDCATVTQYPTPEALWAAIEAEDREAEQEAAMIEPTTALDFAIRHQVVRDRILSQCDGSDLARLALDLLRLYAHASRRLHTDLGAMAVTSALHEVYERTSDPNEKHAAALILAHLMTTDGGGVDADLREMGFETLAERFHIVTVTDRTLAVITAIPIVWQRIVPELTTMGGIGLLEHFSTNELHGG